MPSWFEFDHSRFMRLLEDMSQNYVATAGSRPNLRVILRRLNATLCLESWMTKVMGEDGDTVTTPRTHTPGHDLKAALEMVSVSNPQRPIVRAPYASTCKVNSARLEGDFLGFFLA